MLNWLMWLGREFVFASDCLRKRVGRPQPSVRTAHEQLRRIPDSTEVVHVDPGIEDREIRLVVAVQISRHDDRLPRLDRTVKQFRNVSERAVLLVGEYVDRRFRQSILACFADVESLATSHSDVLTAVSVEIRDCEYKVEPSEIRFGVDARKGDARGTLRRRRRSP